MAIQTINLKFKVFRFQQKQRARNTRSWKRCLLTIRSGSVIVQLQAAFQGRVFADLLKFHYICPFSLPIMRIYCDPPGGLGGGGFLFLHLLGCFAIVACFAVSTLRWCLCLCVVSFVLFFVENVYCLFTFDLELYKIWVNNILNKSKHN